MSDSKLPEIPADRISWVIRAPDQEELRRRYDLWASQYDTDVSDFETYLAPIVTAEVAVLPLVFGAWELALAFSIANGLLLLHRIRVEDAALAPRRSG